MKFHEFKADGSTLAVRRINRYADEIGKESMDYEVFKTAAEMLDKQMLKSLAQLLDDSDTAPREWVMKTIADHDPDTFKKMYGDQEGYLSVMKPDQNLKDDNNESQPDAGSERADAARGMWASSKEIQSRFKTWQDFMNSEDFDEWLDDKFRDEMGEDAGEGHMSKSQLYQTAKMAIELIEMIKHGDDLEAWVQTKLNVAADYLQAVYHYEEYQKLNPYREQIDSNTFAKHSEIVKKSIDEILARETKIDDVDTKPGMMRILGKRVNEVEKNIAKETKQESVKETADKDRAIRFDKAMRSGQYEQFADILSDAMHFASVTNKDFERELQTAKDEFEDQTNEDAAGVGIITKQNTTSDVKPGDEYKNVKKLGLKSSAYESKLTDMLKQRLK